MCCRLKMKLEELWQRTSGCILKIRGVTPDGAGNFELEAGQNVNISEVSNGLRISTTGGVSYYTSDDPQLDIDNDDLKISLVDVAKDSDLDVVAQNVANVINGTTQVGKAAHAGTADSATTAVSAKSATNAAHADAADSATTAASAKSATNSVNAQYLGSSTNNVGSDTKPIKIVNGVATAVTNNVIIDRGGQDVASDMIIVHPAPVKVNNSVFFDGFKRSSDNARVADFYLTKTATGYTLTLRIMNDAGQWAYFDLGSSH